MEESLSELLTQKASLYPFHMPGHKRNPAFLPRDLLSLDTTEIPGADNLHAPSGVLRRLQDAIARFYGADESFLLVNGSSCGLMAAVNAACRPGDVLYMARNCHVSVHHAAVLAHAIPEYVMPDALPGGLAGGVPPDAFSGVSALRAAVVTSPTYEGFMSDIAAIALNVHRRGGILIVDEAHGAHFAFHPSFPQSALRLGADIVVHSLHKTLPALSPCAALHVKGARADRERLRFYLRALQTTSPSYMLMAAAEYTLRLLWADPGHFERYAERLTVLRRSLSVDGADKPLSLFRPDGVFAADPGKILLWAHTDRDGPAIADMLAHRFGLQMEMADGNHVLAMTSVADTSEGFDRLAAAADELNRELPLAKPRAAPPAIPIGEAVMTPAEAMNREAETVDARAAPGRVAAEIIARCPPGIPLAVPGERFATEHVSILRCERPSGVRVVR